jgi:hypothetical protein
VTDRLVRLFVALSNMTYMVKAYGKVGMRERKGVCQTLGRASAGDYYVDYLS